MISTQRVLASGITILTLFSVAGALLYVTVGTANADPAAVIKDDGLCLMLGSDANGNPLFGELGEVTTEVENGNKVMLKCKGTGIANDSGRGQSFDGFLCGIQAPDGNFYFTTDTRATVSAGGVGTLTCTLTF